MPPDAPSVASSGPAADQTPPRERSGAPFPRRLALLGLVFLAGPLLLYARVTLGGQTLVPYDALVGDPAFRGVLADQGIAHPQNGLVADLVFQNVVWKEHLAEVVRGGGIPLWNPYVFAGMPFMAGGQASPLYPLTVLFVAMPAHAAFGWHALITLWIAALGMYFLGRQLGLATGPSVLMGLAWSLSTLFVANTVFPMIQAGMAWTPVLLGAIEGAVTACCRPAPPIERPQVGPTEPAAGSRPGVLPPPRATGWLALAAGATALIALAGHAEILYYAGLLATAYGLTRSWDVGRALGPRQGALVVAWVAAAGVTGVLLAAVQLVPFAELARESWRSGGDGYETARGYAFGIRQAATFLVPDFYGNPAHHRVAGPGATGYLDGGTMWAGAVGAKNYVEAAAYVGIVPLLLAALGLFAGPGRPRRFFAAFGALAATFVFGLPTYRLLYSGLPGIDQLRTPFRWVFPLMLCVVVLAGCGAEALRRRPPRVAGLVAWLALAGGAVLAGVTGAALARPDRWVGGVEALLARAEGAGAAVVETFGTTALFAAYAHGRLAHLALFLLVGGAGLLALIGTARTGDGRRRRTAATLLAVATAADLLLIGHGFNPAVDPALARVTPPVVAWLEDAVDTRWGRIVGFGDARVLWPNTAMRFRLPDVRGYDSIIPEWTAATLDAVEDADEMLRFNRIPNLGQTSSLAHPALRALGGRYVVTTDDLDEGDLELVYDNEVKVYTNQFALPRAWVVDNITVVADEAALIEAVADIDPATTVLLGSEPDEAVLFQRPAGRALSPSPTRITADSPGSLEVDVFAPRSGMLVVSEAWFPGWKATVSSLEEGEGERTGRREVSVGVYRANGMLQAVPVPAGRSTVRMSYSPMSVKVGLYGSFIGALVILLAAAHLLWSRVARVAVTGQLERVAANTVGPMGAALLNKVVDFAFAMLMLRILGPEDAGKYYTAITVIAFAEIFTNFGLNLLTTREVARDPAEAPGYLTQTSVLRLGLWLLALPLLGGYLAFRAATGSALAPDTVLAIGLLALGLVPGNLNSALTSIFQGFERMMVPAGVTMVSTFLKVTLGAAVLVGGFGFVGLAAVSIVVNWATFVILASLLAAEGVRPRMGVRPAALMTMAGVSLPFMLNHLLQTVFFKIDVLLLSQLQGDTVVGWYQAAYKWIDALLIVPGYFTMALFPLMSRQAHNDRDGLRRGYELSVRWLVSLALPVAVATTFLADDLIRILGGAEYLPAGGIALRIMIWFLPLSFVNGLSQYVLLAMDRQRLVTPSFLAAVAFNIGANLWAIPLYGYQGAAVVTILSEVALLVPFAWGLRDLGARPLLVTIWRPALATSLMGAALVALEGAPLPPVLSVAVGSGVYLGVLWLVGGVTEEDRAIVRRLRP